MPAGDPQPLGPGGPREIVKQLEEKVAGDASPEEEGDEPVQGDVDHEVPGGEPPD